MPAFVAQILGLVKKEKGRIIDLILPLVISASILIIFVPLPTFLMDVFLSMNIAMAVVILLTTLFVTKPLDFSIFPTILLATTLFRLVLNIASTRLILTRANIDGEYAAGEVIKNFADFVASGNIVVGLIIFVIIVVIQFVVITKGATRVSEVAARFTLDAMPGRQMAIDADLNAGIIDEREAKRRREEIQLSADFFGSMDGAGKFVRGDAIAGIIITIVNVLGGLFIGMINYGMPIREAATIFTKLTIGDGLVSQVPALLISIATGLLVTRSSQKTNLPEQFVGQLLSKPIVLGLTAFFLFILTLTDLPKLPLWTIALSSIGLALVMNRNTKAVQKAEETKAIEEEAEKIKQEEDKDEDHLKIDRMELAIGIGLIPLADPKRGGHLLDRISRLRKEVAEELGFIFPVIRIRDSFSIDQFHYQIKIESQPVASGMVYPDMYLALDSGGATSGKVQGIETLDPAFGYPALWVDGATKDQAEIFGYMVVEPGAVIATHLQEVIRKHADEILKRDDTQHLLDELRKTSPAVIDELLKVLTLGQIQQVLQMLLREQVPIRQLGTILEVLGDMGIRSKDNVFLLESVRSKLARTISTRYRDENNVLNVVMLDPALEDQIRAGFEHNENGFFLRMSAPKIEQLCNKILKELDKLTQMNLQPVVLVNPQIRFALYQMTKSAIPGLAVLSYSEIISDTKVASVGTVPL